MSAHANMNYVTDIDPANFNKGSRRSGSYLNDLVVTSRVKRFRRGKCTRYQEYFVVLSRQYKRSNATCGNSSCNLAWVSHSS